MPDLKIVWDVPNIRGDFARSGLSLATGDELATQIYESVFTDRQARTDDSVTDGSNDPRGWWSDQAMGSRLWLLERSKLTADAAKFARDCIVESLQWLIDDGVVSKFNVTTEITAPNRLGIQVTAYRKDAQGRDVASNYAYVWQGLV